MKRAILAITILMVSASVNAQPLSPATMRELAHAYYDWSDQQYPVLASDMGKHTWDDRLTDYSPEAIATRKAHVEKILAQVRAADTKSWSKDDKVDWILFRAQLERVEFGDRVRQSETTDPQLYVGEAGNAIFSLIKKEYAPPATRARAATARLRAMPAMIEQGKRNLTHPVRLYAELAIQSARAIDPLFTESLVPITRELPPNEASAFAAARDAAIKSLHDYADWLEKQLPSMKAWEPMGEANYNYMLHHLLLLPFDARQEGELGDIELGRYRGLEAMLLNPSLADPDPHRVAHIPPDQEAFLRAYQSREEEIIDFLKERRLVTLPSYLGPFLIRQLPQAFKPTSPGGFMNPPGVYDADNSGFYFIPTYDPSSRNFYIRAAIEDPRPILGHEGIPGHFLQLSIANHLSDEIRRHHDDTVFIEGWALYTEEMLLRAGLYPANSAGAAQILRLARYRAARIGVDVNLHTGRWTFPQAVRYFMDGGGLDEEAATGEAAGAASEPTQKISYITGKWQIMRLLGKYRDRKGASFRLGEFHDQLISYGSLPVSVIEWLMLDDDSTLEMALGTKP